MKERPPENWEAVSFFSNLYPVAGSLLPASYCGNRIIAPVLAEPAKYA